MLVKGRWERIERMIFNYGFRFGVVEGMDCGLFYWF